MEDWKRRTIEEVATESLLENPLIRENVRYVEFLSRSNGRNRPKRKKSREVRLITWRGKSYSVGSKMTRKIEYLMQDVFPEELATSSPYDWLATFLDALRTAEKLRKANK